MSYGPSIEDAYRQWAVYVGRTPSRAPSRSDLPVEQPTKFEFVINLQTAKDPRPRRPAYGTRRADEVIE